MPKTEDTLISGLFAVTKTVLSYFIDIAAYQEISNTGAAGDFVGVTVPALTSGTYHISINIDGTAHNNIDVAILETDSFAVICAAIQTAIRAVTGGSETVAIISGKIRVTTGITAAAPSVSIADGTTDGLLAAIDSVVGYDTAIGTATTGQGGSIKIPISAILDTRDLVFVAQVLSSSGIEKPGFKYSYNKTTGILTVSDYLTANMAVGDIITVIGTLV